MGKKARQRTERHKYEESLWRGQITLIDGQVVGPSCAIVSCALPRCSRCDRLKLGDNAIHKMAKGRSTTACRHCQYEAQQRYRARKDGHDTPKRRLSLDDLIAQYTMTCGWTHCWVGHHNQGDYPRTTVDGRSESVARAIYQRVMGLCLLPGTVLDHHGTHGCGDSECVSPWCLTPTDARGNVLTGRSPAADNYHKVRCDHGHPFSLANTKRSGKGHRICLTCAEQRRRGRDSDDPDQYELFDVGHYTKPIPCVP